jgi:hypothetical protein
MRARTITIVSVLACAFAIPAAASASYGTVSSDPDAAASGSPHSAAPLTAPDHSALDASLNSPVASPSDGPNAAPVVIDPGTGAVDEGFDWASAAVGAGSAMALVTLGGAALLTVRRRTVMSASTSTS